jgi:hypothetical protein
MKKMLMVALALAFPISGFAQVQIAGEVKGNASAQDGANPKLRQLRTSEMGVGDVHGHFQEAVYRGNVWTCANLGGTPVTTQAGLSATTPALTLYNPSGSNVALVLWRTRASITSSPAAASGLMLAVNTSSAALQAPQVVTAATVYNNLIGNPKQPVGQCYRVATLSAAPLLLAPFGGTTGASAIGGYNPKDDEDGEFILLPGTTISIQTTSATALLGAFTWEEIPYP